LFVLLAFASIAPAQTTAPAARLTLAPYGIEMTPPAGWQQQWERPAGAVARWSPPGADRGKQYLQVVAAPKLKGDTTRANAEREADRWGGVLEETLLDGEPAYRIIEPQQIGVIVIHGDVVYGIAYAHQ